MNLIAPITKTDEDSMNPVLPKPRGQAAVYDRLKDVMHYSELKRMAYGLVARQQKSHFRTLAVLSCYSGEGKTLFCATLAKAYADICGLNVLVVDAASNYDPSSLALKECIDPALLAQVDYLSLSERRNNPNRTRTVAARGVHQQSSIETVGTEQNGHAVAMSVYRDSDHALIRQVAEEGSRQYGLILLDTVALMSRNKKNTDPFIVAQLADASILIVSPKLLKSPDLNACLKVVENPALHLIGMVSNEEFAL
jgi:Mrp family chromosome partitioning ATPase